MDNETWILEKGDEIIELMTSNGYEALSSKQKLTYSFWVLDYSIRNAGDVETAYDLFPEFNIDGLRYAQELNLEKTIEYFSKKVEGVTSSFYDYFELICEELKK